MARHFSKIMCIVMISAALSVTVLCALDESPELGTEEIMRLDLIREAYFKMDKYYFKEVSIKNVGNLFYRCQFIMMSLLRNLDDDYAKNLDTLTYSTINMIVAALKDPTDAYSKFIHKDYLQRVVREQLKSKFDGIGIEVEQKDMFFFVSTVYANSSASERGVAAGEQLLAINDESTIGLELSDIEKKLKIASGMSVKLSLLRPEETLPYHVFLECRIIIVPSVTSEYNDTRRIGTIRISKFRSLTGEEFQTALNELSVLPLRGLIIDLRDNSGGDETQALAISSLFLDRDSLVVYFVKRDIGRTEERTHSDPIQFPHPIVIVVNTATASSSEILSGAMKHYGKALLVGEQTKGQGSLKNTVSLSDGSALFLITSRTYLPDGETFDEKGIAPHFIVAGREAQMEKAFQLIEESSALSAQTGV